MMTNLLPDLPGCVHGIVSMDPPTIQCDGCGHTFSHRSIAYAAILSGIVFEPSRHPDTRRLCRECRRVEWPETMGLPIR